MKLQDYILVNEQIFHFINNESFDIKNKNKVVKNLLKYIKHLKKEKLQEAIAHFASLLEKANFEKVLAFVFAESEELMVEISDYIAKIDL